MLKAGRAIALRWHDNMIDFERLRNVKTQNDMMDWLNSEFGQSNQEVDPTEEDYEKLRKWEGGLEDMTPSSGAKYNWQRHRERQSPNRIFPWMKRAPRNWRRNF